MLFCSALLLSPVLKPFFFKSSPRKVSAHVPNFSSRAFSSSRLVLWALRAQLHFSVCQRFLSVKHGSSSLTSSFPSLVSLTSWPRFLICPMLQSQTLHFYLGLFPVPDPQCFYSCSRLCLTRSVAVCWVAALSSFFILSVRPCFLPRVSIRHWSSPHFCSWSYSISSSHLLLALTLI